MTHTDSSADALADRRALRRKLTFWRVSAFVVLIALVLGFGWRFSIERRLGTNSPQIARIAIGGLITGDRPTIDLIARVARTPSVKGVILSIESPGGTTTGAERLYDALRLLAAKKPVVADVEGMAASGAYIAALGADHIVAQGNSLVGSIGVLFEFPNVSKLLDTVGVTVEEIKSSPLKAAPDGFTPTSPEARAALAGLIDDSFDWFKQLVKSRRGMTDAQLATVSDGRVFTGRQGLGLKLVDQLGEERDARAWLETQKNIPKGLPIRDWKPAARGGAFSMFGAAANIASFLGADSAAATLRQVAEFRKAAILDGLTSIWQAGGAH